jgi:uncharacterized protein (TIGR00255 family)
MLKSMTGFGKASVQLKNKLIVVELRSVNSKQLDLNMRISSIYREKEQELRNEVSQKLERGKIDFNLYSDASESEKQISINKKIAKQYFREFNSLANDLKIKTDNLLTQILKMPDVIQTDKQDLDEKEWSKIKSAAIKAIAELDKFRSAEGKTLKRDLEKRVHLILNYLTEVEAHDVQRLKNVRERLNKAVAELIEKIDQSRFEQELIYYLEKLDITEEKVRLKTHCDYFLKTMQEQSSGRKLAFISQEIGREINTIGSKANDAVMQKIVVQMKDELEKIKEQLNNVL